MPTKRRIIILASVSSRRKKILKSAHINFKVIYPFIKEKISSKHRISFLVKYNALEKAKAVAKKLKSGIVLGVDTLVLFKKKIIGKIYSFKEAEYLLKKMLGKKVEVYTGLCVIDIDNRRYVLDYDKTTVYVSRISLRKIRKFLKYLGPFDKAGGFTIEGLGAILFDKINGSYFNALGLSLRKLALLLEKLDLDISDFIK